MRHNSRFASLLALLSLLSLSATGAAQQSPFDSLHFRNIGPAATGGRIHDIEVDPTDPATIYVAAASGGIWKTTNRGTFWFPIFDKMPENTFGDLAIAPSNSRIIYAGSGEQNNRQSSSWGSGVYKTTDAGATWTHIGLENTTSIGRVIVHPTDPNIVYAAAVGNLWKASPERGVYKTTDGGRTWNRILYVDTLTGATDMVMDPRNPNVLYAATYQRLRSAFGFNGGGPGSALYKTTDGGATWTKLEKGIPAGDKGRIGLAISKSNPDVVVALIEHATESGTYRSDDAGATWRRVSRQNPRPMYYSAPFIDPTTDKRIWILGTTIVKSEDGGNTFEGAPTSPAYDIGLKTDHHTMWIDPRDTRHVIIGGDGGLNESFDLGNTYVRMNNIPIGQFYHIAVDDRDPYFIYGGLQDNHSWMGPSATRHWLGILNQDWVQIGLSDGTGQAVDKSGYHTIYTSSTNGNVQRFDPITGDRYDIKPIPPRGDSAYRWDWDAPLIASQHTPGTVYVGANRLFISHDRGVTWTRTEDLTRQVNRDTIPLMGKKGRDIRISRNDGETTSSELTTIAESPLDAKVLWVGTDDGNVQVSQDGGKTWKEVSAAVTSGTGIASGTFVSRVVASSASRGTAYAAFDAHRSGDFAPYIARTTDFGKTWTRITDGLPGDASVRSIYEYPGKANLELAGTERHLFVSRDSGAHWSQLTANLPTTIYYDMVVQPRTHDLVVATHGRGLWVLDDATPLADWSPRIAATSMYLFAPARATVMQYWDDISNMAQGFFAAENPADGATFTYWLSKPAQKVRLVVRGPTGKVIRTVDGKTAADVINRSVWDLRHEPPPATPGRGGGEEGGGGGEEATGGRGGRPALPIPMHEIGNRGPYVSPGTYSVTLDVDGDTTSRTFEVRGDPALPVTVAQHKARETFLLDVQAQQVKVEQMAATLRQRRTGATGADSAKLVALERRLTGGRDAPRAKLGAIARAYNGNGAQQGSLYPPSAQYRQALVEAKAEVAAIEKELAALKP
ncbi:MAG TPA: hypothetical protein VN706_15340 [Gemmatimonadaceae bacterium]|nr:hypothetical protein [Gemmatimonadaceae bacterium]